MNTATDIATDTATDTAIEHTFNPQDVIDGEGQPGALVSVNVDTVYGAIDTLLRFDEFFRRHRGEHHDEHGSGPVHAALRALCAGLGWHPVSGTDALLDQLGLYAWSLQRALDTAEDCHLDITTDSTTKETA
ncbi:MAG TPA: hypothetical protein VFC19_19640 [Candidatus Limnocylindrales bacterium]|nr:hypothetical protein [Candidatus Limnocylindrales bacterium]